MQLSLSGAQTACGAQGSSVWFPDLRRDEQFIDIGDHGQVLGRRKGVDRDAGRDISGGDDSILCGVARLCGFLRARALRRI